MNIKSYSSLYDALVETGGLCFVLFRVKRIYCQLQGRIVLKDREDKYIFYVQSFYVSSAFILMLEM